MHQLNRKVYTDSSKLLDQYYTKYESVTICMDAIEKHDTDYDMVIDPSAGGGAFFDRINNLPKIGLDIASNRVDILQCDWLRYSVSSEFNSVLIIGNPPFGQYHKLSSVFIAHSMLFPNVKTIAFVLPNGYKKHTRQKIIPRGWRIASITDLPKNSFTFGGVDYHVPCAFFILDKSVGCDLRVDITRHQEVADFNFGTKKDFDVFIFGAAPTRVIKNPQSNNRGHFIKSNIPVPTLINRIKSVPWKGCSSASGGVFWLTKTEVLQQYAECYE